ncbi:glycosyltransferase family 61 protein [Tabrizicola sp.]|uniref:glycosyltransferase family 61 protein n=1 Tax=Tabrizicola sp. TaxID=2005166 RepID=UPI00286A5C42|nr:glycosyltransferase family 61 protein [Tabrizicola sp.]
MTEWSGVLPQEMPAAQIDHVANAVIRPPGPEDMKGLRQVCGVFRPDGSPIAAAGTLSSDGELCLPAEVPNSVRRREGAWVFGGLLFNHFGHALIYSTARLWAVRKLLDDGVPLQGVLFHRRYTADPAHDPEIPRNAAAIFGVFAPDVPVVATAENEEVEDLYIPSQGISTTPELFAGLPEQRRFFRDSAAKIPPNSEPRDIYVSRTKTGWKGNHLFEREIERALAEAGYHVFHPQFHTLADQIATYRSARRLIAVDGSALHVVAMAVPADAKVAVITRREFFAWAIADQIRAFAGCTVQVIEAHVDVYAFSRGLGRHSSWSKTQVTTDFSRLGSALVDAGFLSTLPDWRYPSEGDLAARLAEAAAKIGDTLLPVPDHLRGREPYCKAHLRADRGSVPD